MHDVSLVRMFQSFSNLTTLLERHRTAASALRTHATSVSSPRWPGVSPRDDPQIAARPISSDA
jgi:hypothetical protein